MNTPYEKYRNEKYWKIIDTAINELLENNDLEIKTHPDYVIGYLTKALTENKCTH